MGKTKKKKTNYNYKKPKGWTDIPEIKGRSTKQFTKRTGCVLCGEPLSHDAPQHRKLCDKCRKRRGGNYGNKMGI